MIARSPESFTHEILEGDDLPGESFEVWNAGTGTLSYTITDNANWLTISPSGGTSTGEHDTITISYQPSALPVGSHLGTITITDPAASPTSATVTVSLNVVASPFAPADFNPLETLLKGECHGTTAE